MQDGAVAIVVTVGIVGTYLLAHTLSALAPYVAYQLQVVSTRIVIMPSLVGIVAFPTVGTLHASEAETVASTTAFTAIVAVDLLTSRCYKKLGIRDIRARPASILHLQVGRKERMIRSVRKASTIHTKPEVITRRVLIRDAYVRIVDKADNLPEGIGIIISEGSDSDIRIEHVVIEDVIILKGRLVVQQSHLDLRPQKAFKEHYIGIRIMLL
jgi:hypothetical protein